MVLELCADSQTNMHDKSNRHIFAILSYEHAKKTAKRGKVKF
jgi:hypothetical protein